MAVVVSLVVIAGVSDTRRTRGYTMRLSLECISRFLEWISSFWAGMKRMSNIAFS